MLFSRACRGTRLGSYLKNVHFTLYASRGTPDILGSSNKSLRDVTECGHAFHTRISGLISRCEYSKTGMSNSFSRLKPLGSLRTGRLFYLPAVQCHYTIQAATERKSKKMLYYLTALTFAMVGLTYAAVPLYRRFCQATGYGGTVQRRETVEEKIARHTKDGTTTQREIVVQFNADVADGMQWKFIPTQREVRVKPGESALAFYTAENKSSSPITGVSTYNVTPMKAAVYFNKIQCFCFEEQRLLPGEQIDMPVFFYIDPEFETDPRMDGINNIILSYTFFKVSEENIESEKVESVEPQVKVDGNT